MKIPDIPVWFTKFIGWVLILGIWEHAGMETACFCMLVLLNTKWEKITW